MSASETPASRRTAGAKRTPGGRRAVTSRSAADAASPALFADTDDGTATDRATTIGNARTTIGASSSVARTDLTAGSGARTARSAMSSSARRSRHPADSSYEPYFLRNQLQQQQGRDDVSGDDDLERLEGGGGEFNTDEAESTPLYRMLADPALVAAIETIAPLTADGALRVNFAAAAKASAERTRRAAATAAAPGTATQLEFTQVTQAALERVHATAVAAGGVLLADVPRAAAHGLFDSAVAPAAAAASGLAHWMSTQPVPGDDADVASVTGTAFGRDHVGVGDTRSSQTVQPPRFAGLDGVPVSPAPSQLHVDQVVSSGVTRRNFSSQVYWYELPRPKAPWPVVPFALDLLAFGRRMGVTLEGVPAIASVAELGAVAALNAANQPLPAADGAAAGAAASSSMASPISTQMGATPLHAKRPKKVPPPTPTPLHTRFLSAAAAVHYAAETVLVPAAVLAELAVTSGAGAVDGTSAGAALASQRNRLVTHLSQTAGTQTADDDDDVSGSALSAEAGGTSAGAQGTTSAALATVIALVDAAMASPTNHPDERPNSQPSNGSVPPAPRSAASVIARGATAQLVLKAAGAHLQPAQHGHDGDASGPRVRHAAALGAAAEEIREHAEGTTGAPLEHAYFPPEALPSDLRHAATLTIGAASGIDAETAAAAAGAPARRGSRVDARVTPLGALNDLLVALHAPRVSVTEWRRDAAEIADAYRRAAAARAAAAAAAAAAAHAGRGGAGRGGRGGRRGGAAAAATLGAASAAHEALPPPTQTLLSRVLGRRGLTCLPLDAAQLRSRMTVGNFFHIGTRGLILVDRETPKFAVLFGAPYLRPAQHPLPTGGDGAPAAAPTEGVIQCLCPIAEPAPFCMRLRRVEHIQARDCVGLLVQRDGIATDAAPRRMGSAASSREGSVAASDRATSVASTEAGAYDPDAESVCISDVSSHGLEAADDADDTASGTPRRDRLAERRTRAIIRALADRRALLRAARDGVVRIQQCNSGSLEGARRRRRARSAESATSGADGDATTFGTPQGGRSVARSTAAGRRIVRWDEAAGHAALALLPAHVDAGRAQQRERRGAADPWHMRLLKKKSQRAALRREAVAGVQHRAGAGEAADEMAWDA